MKTPDKAVVLCEDEGEFTTDSVVRIGDDYFFRHQNGGARGAWDCRNCGGQLFRATAISRTDARAKLLEMGMSPEKVAKVTA